MINNSDSYIFDNIDGNNNIFKVDQLNIINHYHSYASLIAIYNNDNKVIIKNSYFYNNSLEYGGIIYVFSSNNYIKFSESIINRTFSNL